MDIKELTELYEKTEKGILDILNDRLKDTSENIMVECCVPTPNAGYFGMGELEKPTVTKIYKDDGGIMVYLNDDEDPVPLNFLDLEWQYELAKESGSWEAIHPKDIMIGDKVHFGAYGDFDTDTVYIVQDIKPTDEIFGGKIYKLVNGTHEVDAYADEVKQA